HFRAAAVDGLDRPHDARDAWPPAERERHPPDAACLGSRSHREARRGRARSVRAPLASGRRPARGTFRSLRGAAAPARVARDLFGTASALALERGPHWVAAPFTSPELRGQADGQPRAAAHDRPPGTSRAPRIKGTARGSPRGLFVYVDPKVSCGSCPCPCRSRSTSPWTCSPCPWP